MAGLQLNSTEILARARKPDLWLRLLKVYGLYIAIALVGRGLEDLFQLTELAPFEGRDDPQIASLVFVALVTFAWTLVSSAVGLTLNARLLFRETTSGTLSTLRTAELMCIETIRAIASTLVRLPFLIIPGLFEWIRLTPISYLILFDPAYQNGDVDALAQAKAFFRLHRFRVVFFLMLSFVVFLAEFSMTESPSDALPLWQAPIQHMGSILIFSLLRLGCDTFTLYGYASQFTRLTAPIDSMSHQA